MNAMIYQEYGPPENLKLQEVDIPSVGADELRVKTHAASVNWMDWHLLAGRPFMARLMAGGLLAPKRKILGVDFAGTVEAIGRNAAQFQPGDEVFGSTGDGCFAEYVCVREDEAQPIPANLTFEEAAAVGAAASTALRGLRDAGEIKSGQKVLINGASGGVGTFAVQVAKSWEAEVTAVCGTSNLDLVRSLGADQVIDYTRDDFTRDGQLYDLIFDAVAKLSYSDCRHVLEPEGIYVTTAFTPGLVLAGMWTSITGDRKLAPLPPRAPTRSDQAFLRDLLESGQVKPIIDRCYTLSELPEALRYLEQGHAQGKVIITI